MSFRFSKCVRYCVLVRNFIFLFCFRFLCSYVLFLAWVHVSLICLSLHPPPFFFPVFSFLFFDLLFFFLCLYCLDYLARFSQPVRHASIARPPLTLTCHSEPSRRQHNVTILLLALHNTSKGNNWSALNLFDQLGCVGILCTTYLRTIIEVNTIAEWHIRPDWLNPKLCQ